MVTESSLPSSITDPHQPHIEPLTFWRMVTGAQIAQAVHVAAQLNIADHLIAGPLDVKELAQRCEVHEQTLYRLLRALSSVGVFYEDEQKRFHLNEIAQSLRTDVPFSLHPLILLCHTSAHWRAWDNLTHSIKTGENSFQHLYKQSYWDYLNQQPEEREICHKALSGISVTEIQAIFDAYDFAGYPLIVDVGGGWGKLLTLILQSYAEARGILFDLPLVAAEASAQIKESTVAERCAVEAGDMFLSVPQGGDLYIVKSVIHDWDDDHVVTLLKNCRAAMKAGARILLIEQVLKPANVSDTGKFLDLFLLAVIGGQERTFEEFQVLIEQAGLVFERIVPTSTNMSIVECRKHADDI